MTEAQNARRREKRRAQAAQDPDFWKKLKGRRGGQRGPSGTHAETPAPNVATGLELFGQSTRINGSGDLSQRWDKTRPQREDEPPPAIEGHQVVSQSVGTDGDGRPFAVWTRTEPAKAEREAAFWAACEAHAARVAVPIPVIDAPEPGRADLVQVYPIGDPHIGLLSWAPETGAHHDARIAEQDLIGVVDMLVDRSPNASTALLANLGDFFHAQGDEQRTPKGGNKLDVDGRRGKILELGLSLMDRLTRRLLEKHDRVIVVNVRGNHDPDMAAMIGLWLKATFSAQPRVEIEPTHDPYWYRRFGQVFVQITHGDGAKPERLAQLAAADRPEDWGVTKFRYGYGGHVHSKHRIEMPGFRWESFGTLAYRDHWAHHAGYRSDQELTSITLHRDWGEIARITVDLRQARAIAGRA